MFVGGKEKQEFEVSASWWNRSRTVIEPISHYAGRRDLNESMNVRWNGQKHTHDH